MGATSVTGVGPGSALGHNKGGENTTLGVSKLLGPHLVAAGSLTVGATNHFALPLASGSYACFFELHGFWLCYSCKRFTRIC